MIFIPLFLSIFSFNMWCTEGNNDFAFLMQDKSKTATKEEIKAELTNAKILLQTTTKIAKKDIEFMLQNLMKYNSVIIDKVSNLMVKIKDQGDYNKCALIGAGVSLSMFFTEAKKQNISYSIFEKILISAFTGALISSVHYYLRQNNFQIAKEYAEINLLIIEVRNLLLEKQ